MFDKVIKAIKRPERIIPYFIFRIKQSRVKEVLRNGELFYQYQGELYPDYLNQGDACQFITEKALTFCRGNGIDIGADKWPLPGAIPIQNEPHLNAYRLDGYRDNSLDYVFSSHCLEHLERWEKALLLWISKLKPGGILFLYLPHESMKLWNPGEPWVGSCHKWKPKHEILIPFLTENGMDVMEYDSYRDKYWSFYIVCKRI